MVKEREFLRFRHDSVPYAHLPSKWRVQTGASLGAILSACIEIFWRGMSVEWNFLSDQAQKLITLESIMGSMIAGGACGAMVCLIRNQRKNARAADE